MKPIAVFQHTEVGAPGSIVPILEALGRDVRLIRVVAGEAVPVEAAAFGGLVFLGGYMSVHDTLPWIPQELALIRDADARSIPVAGHCLGSQLIALALGGEVHQDTRPEIGWCNIDADAGPIAREWWGSDAGRVLQTFQWHGDTFTPPGGAQRIASGAYCGNQAYVLRGMHLLIQSHLELTPELVALSMDRNGEQLLRQNALRNAAASAYGDVLNNLPQRCANMRKLLERLYARWIRGCA